MANHALLMKRRTPTIPQPVSANPIWRYGNRPTIFTGTVYTDGSTTINHSFPEARRSGFAAVVIGEQLRDSDNDITIGDDTYRPELQSEKDITHQGASDDEQEPAPITIPHSASHWPIHIPHYHRNVIGAIHEKRIRDMGVSTTWRILIIQDEDVLSKCTKEVIDNHKKQAARNNYQVTTVLISPQQCKREWAARRKCKCPNTNYQWHNCTQWCRDNYGCNGECKKKNLHQKDNRETTCRRTGPVWALKRLPANNAQGRAGSNSMHPRARPTSNTHCNGP